MTLARLILEIRRRAGSLPDELPQAVAIERAAREVLGTAPIDQQENDARQIMAGLLGIAEGQDFDASILDELTPEAVLRVDRILHEFLELGRTDAAVRAARAALIRAVK
jgi:hypothetical protein